MNGLSLVALALAVLACLGIASAAERQGKVQVVNTSDRVVLLEDGTTLWLAEGLITHQLREGLTVKLSYEERDGKHVVTRIDTAE
jgi:hypothetical protein